MVSKLTLLSRFMFVTTEEQAKELLSLYEKNPKALGGLLVFLDSSLVISKRHAYKLTVALIYLLCHCRQLNVGFLIVGNEEAKLDKRIESQLTHSSMIVSQEWPKDVIL